MINIEDVLLVHQRLTALFGGSNGVRDMSGLEAALARPFQTFGSEELYPSSIEKAAAIGESIIMNHPFVDGNKRTGYVLIETILRINKLYIDTTTEEKYQFVISISTGQKRFEEIVLWLQGNTKPMHD
jgi:death on curing protein